MVNNRVHRLYSDKEHKLKEWFREGKLFNIRNASFYWEIEDSVITPDEAVTEDDARLLVSISGEVLAEIQGCYTGTGSNEWKSLLTEVNEFREAHR